MTRNLSVDALRLFLALLVVTIHANFAKESHPVAGYVVTTYLARVAVPLFFMISGYYFFHVLQRDRARPWLLHALKLYLVWTAAYLPLVWIAHPDYTPAQTVQSMLTRLLIADWFLWFVHALPLVGLLTLWLRDRRPVPMLWTLAALYLVAVVLQYLATYDAWAGTPHAAWAEQIPVYRNFLFVGLPFFYLGYLIARHRVGEDFGAGRKAMLLAAGAAGMALEFAINHAHGQTVVGGFDVLASLPLLAFAVFLIAVHARARAASRTLADLATAIYLVHPMFLFLLRRYGPFEGSIAMAAVAVLLSAAVTPLLVALNRRLGWVL